MAYPDLPPSPTFWRCPACGNEAEFHASGTSQITCARCGKTWTDERLVDAHAAAHPPTAASREAAPSAQPR